MDHQPPWRRRSVYIPDRNLAPWAQIMFGFHAWVSFPSFQSLLPRPSHTRVAGDCFPWTISLLTRSCGVEGGGGCRVSPGGGWWRVRRSAKADTRRTLPLSTTGAAKAARRPVSGRGCRVLSGGGQWRVGRSAKAGTGRIIPLSTKCCSCCSTSTTGGGEGVWPLLLQPTPPRWRRLHSRRRCRPSAKH